MTEIIEPGVLETPKRRRKLRISDIIIFAVLIIVIVLLAVTIVNKLRLKHEVNGALSASNKVIAALDKRDGNAARNLGSSKFKATYSAAQLTTGFKAIVVTTNHTPTVDKQTVVNGKNKVVYFIYKYPPHLAKMPYYVRVIVTQDAKSGQWQLTNLSGNATETNLILGY